MSESYKVLGQEGAAELFIDKKFVAVSGYNPYTSNIAAYSTNGITWTQTTMPNSDPWEAVAYGDGVFVAAPSEAGQGNPERAVHYSTDGITWTETLLPEDPFAPGEQVELGSGVKLAYGDGKFLLTGLIRQFLSSDGAITWEEVSTPTWPLGLTYGDGKFVAVSDNSNIAAYSTDGITWTQSTLPANTSWWSVTYGDGKFVAVSQTSTAAYSTDAITWTGTSLPLNTAIFNGTPVELPESSGFWRSVTYGDDKFVAVAGYFAFITYAYSTDAAVWTQGSMPSASPWESVIYADNKFVAISGGYSYASSAAYSTDGITWTQTTLPASTTWTSVAYGQKDPELLSQNQYTVPANASASISSILIVNSDPVSHTYSVGVVKAADTGTPGISSSQTLIPTRTIESGVTDEIVGGIVLSAGDQIRTTSDSEDLIIHVYGAELS